MERREVERLHRLTQLNAINKGLKPLTKGEGEEENAQHGSRLAFPTFGKIFHSFGLPFRIPCKTVQGGKEIKVETGSTKNRSNPFKPNGSIQLNLVQGIKLVHNQLEAETNSESVQN